MEIFDITKPEFAYIFGLLQTDGHLRETTRNRSQITLEISNKDVDIIIAIRSILASIGVKSSFMQRTRDTQFKSNYTTCGFCVCNYHFKEHLKRIGLPAGSKSTIISEPQNILKIDYYRGIIDGDGSLGVTHKNFPFISLVTSSEALAMSYINFIQEICGVHKTCSRNKRDNIYNISLFKEHAQTMIRTLYYTDCLSLKRKYQKATEALTWIRPAKMRRNPPNKRWNDNEDQYILNHSLKDSMETLQRSKASIQSRLRKLSCQISSELPSSYNS